MCAVLLYAHLKAYFGGEELKADKKAEKYSGMRASRVGTAQLAGYLERRQREKASKSTINRELALLRRAFSLGFDFAPQKVVHVPKFKRFIVSEQGSGRRGFVEEPHYRKLMELAAKLWPAELWLRGLLALAYTYGFRKSELIGRIEKGVWEKQPMRCSQVDLLNDTICLYSGETKNLEGRFVALTKECRELVVELRKGKQPARRLGCRSDSSGLAWLAAARLSTLGRPEHDSGGLATKNSAEISGHKIDSVFNRLQRRGRSRHSGCGKKA